MLYALPVCLPFLKKLGLGATAVSLQVFEALAPRMEFQLCHEFSACAFCVALCRLTSVGLRIFKDLGPQHPGSLPQTRLCARLALPAEVPWAVVLGTMGVHQRRALGLSELS